MKPGRLGVQSDIGHFQGQAAAVGHRVPGIEAQIHQDLVDLPQIGLNAPRLGGDVDDQVDARIDGPPQQGHGFFQSGGQVRRFQSQRGLAREAEELACQLRGPQGRFFREPEELTVGIVSAQRRLHQGNIAQDHRQQVVEVVGHSAGQLTNGFHLLRLPELRFQGPLFRDVPEYTQDARDLSLIVLDRGLDHAGHPGALRVPPGDEDVAGKLVPYSVGRGAHAAGLHPRLGELPDRPRELYGCAARGQHRARGDYWLALAGR